MAVCESDAVRRKIYIGDLRDDDGEYEPTQQILESNKITFPTASDKTILLFGRTNTESGAFEELYESAKDAGGRGIFRYD